MRWACSTGVLALALAACGGTALAPSAPSTAPAVKSVPFSEVAASQHANYDGGAEVLVGASTAAREEILRRVHTANAPSSSVLVVTATFTVPPADGFVTQVITSPAHLVSIVSADLAGAKTAVLRDASGAERARASIP